MARLETLTPTKVQGLPQETTHFPRRFRNKNPLIIRQIVSSTVLEQWSSHPEYVIQALNQTASGSEGVQEQEEEEEEPLLPVMVAEDTKNFMDNPQFTRKIDMTAREIVARVLRSSLKDGEEVEVEVDSEVIVPQLDIRVEAQQQQVGGGGDVVVPALALVESAFSSSSSLPLSSSVSVSSEPDSSLSAAATATATAGNTCPLCDHQDTATTSTTTQDKDNRRFYYRGMEYQRHLDDNMAEVQRRWPKIRNTTPWIVDLEPGDALYTPPGFWHEVTSVDHSVSITVPWDMDADELQSVPRHMI
ncbi:hypothetical protein BGZ95_000230 [Linnemannia exigua]|uniref:JmjC domain-containing protein n=1 Tax=Linnemannia exigua TaxID=604196 RepID=A0AAD4H5S1_9FUNG|nr:hypothetical protein BGZ95_000230 [Linnemannia exigua]